MTHYPFFARYCEIREVVLILETNGKVLPLRGGTPLNRNPWLSPRRWVVLVTAVVVVYFIFTAASNTLQAIQVGQEEESLRQEVDGLAEWHTRLTALRDYWKSDEYIEFVARRELGLVRPGELGIVVISAVTPTPPLEPPKPVWEALSGE